MILLTIPRCECCDEEHPLTSFEDASDRGDDYREPVELCYDCAVALGLQPLPWVDPDEGL